MQAEQIENHAESQAQVNSTNATALSFNLRLQYLECALGRMTHNVHLMLRRINDWENEVSPNACSDGLLDLRASTVDIVRKAFYIGHDGNDSDNDFNI